MIEVERKFRLTPTQKSAILSQLMATYGDMPAVRQIDTVYLRDTKTFANFKPGMPVMRIRTINDNSILTYKRGVNKDGDSLEYELTVDNAQTAHLLLQELGFTEVTTITKTRHEAKHSGFSITIDTVDSLGDFLEIETIVNDVTKIESATNDILALAGDFGLSANDVEPLKYDQLLTNNT